MKKKIFLKITVAAICVVAFFANVSINENNATENDGLLTIGKIAKAECDKGTILNGKCNGTNTRCVIGMEPYDCDPNS